MILNNNVGHLSAQGGSLDDKINEDHFNALRDIYTFNFSQSGTLAEQVKRTGIKTINNVGMNAISRRFLRRFNFC